MLSAEMFNQHANHKKSSHFLPHSNSSEMYYFLEKQEKWCSDI